MKKLFIVLAMSLLAATHTMAQDVANEIKRISKEVADDQKQDLQTRRIAYFKVAVVDYRKMKVREEVLKDTNNIKVFNGSRINALSNDKWAAHFWARYLGMPVLDGALYNPSNITLPAVVKSRMGHGGMDVQIVSTPEEAHKLRLHGNDEDYIMQKIASERGKDLRVYIIGDEIVACMLRTNENDFRANYSLGAKAELVELPEDVERYLKVVIYDLHPDFIGVDFLIDDGKYVFNEVEDPVGSKMLYENTDIDPIRLFGEHIISSLKLD